MAAPAFADEPVQFTRDVVPVLTKAGCNSGACHGSFQGRGGLKLSLLGFDPAADYTALVEEARGRRVFAASPGDSLVLRKPAGKVLALAADTLTDVDDDGFGVANRLSDPDPNDARIFPYALDVPGNGVDEDGVGGDLPAGLPPYTESIDAARWSRRPDVVLIVLESFRFDVLGGRFEGRTITPVTPLISKYMSYAWLGLLHWPLASAGNR